jgi:hypothetical protein
MRRTYFRDVTSGPMSSGYVTSLPVTSLPVRVTSDDVIFGSTTTSNMTWTVLIYYSGSMLILTWVGIIFVIILQEVHWKGAHMRNRNLSNIRPSWAFSPVVSQSREPEVGSCACIRKRKLGFPALFLLFSDMLCLHVIFFFFRFFLNTGKWIFLMTLHK